MSGRPLVGSGNCVPPGSSGSPSLLLRWRRLATGGHGLSLDAEDAGYEVDDVADGEEALRRYGERRYDLVLDIMMPNACGAAVFRALRREHPAAKGMASPRPVLT